MKVFRSVLPLVFIFSLLLTGCGALQGADTPPESETGESTSSGQTAAPVETVEPFPYGGPLALDETQQAAADFAASLLSGDLRWELPPFRHYAELENEHGDLLLRILSAHEGDLLRTGGRVTDLQSLPGYEETEASQAPANARFYTLDAASDLLNRLFGAEPDWTSLAEQLPGQVLPGTGVVCIQSLDAAEAETCAVPVAFDTTEGGWVFQFAVCVKEKDAAEWLDYTSGASLGTPEADETMEAFLFRQLSSVGLVTATVVENEDGTFRLTRLEGTYTVGTLQAAE